MSGGKMTIYGEVEDLDVFTDGLFNKNIIRY